MTDLQTSLIVIGSAIVTGVVFYNKWQENKAKKSVLRAFSSEHEDVLMTPESGVPHAKVNVERHEPSLAGETASVPRAENGLLSEELRAPEFPAAAAAIVQQQTATADLPVDEIIDYPIPLHLDGSIRAEKILPAVQTLRHIGNKPVHFIGQRAADGGWEAIAHGTLYTSLQAGIQLANRSSALNELEYSEFVTRLRQLGDGLGAEPNVPDMAKVMHAARDLHQFVTEFDAKLSISIQANGAPWAIGTLLSALEKQGFDLRPDGKLIMSDGEGGVLFALLTNVTMAEDTTSRLTLLLDVPCVAPQRDGFGAMVACARSLSMRLQGTVVDDTNQPIADAALSEIAEQVRSFYDSMEKSGISAGSIKALRLFG